MDQGKGVINKQPSWKRISEGIYLVLLLIIVIPLSPIVLLIFGLYQIVMGTWLGLMVKLQWYPKGKYMLFVYSNSPNWKEYIEINILPKISAQAVVINWSERSQWEWDKKSLELKVFQHWTGVHRYFEKGKRKWSGEAFNPIAIVFIPWWKREVLCFWEPFKTFKHGKEKPLKELEASLFRSLDRLKQL